MKKMYRAASLILAGVMTASLAACGGSSGQTAATTAAPDAAETAPETEAASEAETEAPADEEPVTLRFSWWGNDARHEKTIKVIEMYQELHPNVTIEAEYRGQSEREKIATELGSGTAADILQLNPPWMGDFVNNGDFFVDLSQYNFDVEGFDEKLINDYCIYNDTLITLPSGLNARCFLVNKTKADELGIAADMDTAWTWEDVIEIGKTVNEANPDMYFLNADKHEMVEFVMRPFIIQKTGQFLISDDYEMGFTRADLVEALDYISRLYSSGAAAPAAEANVFLNSSWTNPDWINGDLVTTLSWTSLLEGATGDSEFEFVTTQLPMRETVLDTSTVVKPSQLYAITKTCENPDVAADFLNFLLTDVEAGKVLGDCRSVPPYKAVQDACMEAGVLSENVITATQYAQSTAGLYENTASVNEEIASILEDAVEVVSYDPSQVEAAADQALVLIEDVLSSLQ